MKKDPKIHPEVNKDINSKPLTDIEKAWNKLDDEYKQNPKRSKEVHPESFETNPKNKPVSEKFKLHGNKVVPSLDFSLITPDNSESIGGWMGKKPTITTNAMEDLTPRLNQDKSSRGIARNNSKENKDLKVEDFKDEFPTNNLSKKTTNSHTIPLTSGKLVLCHIFLENQRFAVNSTF